MRYVRSLAFLPIAISLVAAACSPAGDGPLGDPLPGTSAEEIRRILDESEQPLVLNVWASWCIPCRSEAPLLNEAYGQFGEQIRFIGVNVGDTQEGAREFLAEFGLEFEHFFDPGRSVPAALGGSGVPLTFFFAPGGELVHYQPGVIDERTLALQLDELLQRRA